MTMTLTPTSELEAVNEMLTAIGEVPVNTLDIAGLSDAAIAKDVLRAITREVLTRGWYFNTDDDYSLSVDGDGHAAIPAAVLKFRPGVSESRRLIPRANRVYDLDAKSAVFTADSPPLAYLVWFFTFEELPETFRRFITIRAARIFQTKVVGSETLHSFTSEHEFEAMAAILAEQNEYEPANYVSDSRDVSSVWNT